MPVPSTPQDLITLIREKLYDNTSGIIEEDTLRNVLENIIKVLDAKFSFFSPTLTEEQYAQWNLMLDFMLRETKGVLTISSTAPTGTTAKGKYLLSDVGTYTNLGGIVTTAGKLNYAYFDGSTWTLIGTELDIIDLTSQSISLTGDQKYNSVKNTGLMRILNQKFYFDNGGFCKTFKYNGFLYLFVYNLFYQNETKTVNLAPEPLSFKIDSNYGVLLADLTAESIAFVDNSIQDQWESLQEDGNFAMRKSVILVTCADGAFTSDIPCINATLYQSPKDKIIPDYSEKYDFGFGLNSDFEHNFTNLTEVSEGLQIVGASSQGIWHKKTSNSKEHNFSATFKIVSNTEVVMKTKTALSNETFGLYNSSSGLLQVTFAGFTSNTNLVSNVNDWVKLSLKFYYDSYILELQNITQGKKASIKININVTNTMGGLLPISAQAGFYVDAGTIILKEFTQSDLLENRPIETLFLGDSISSLYYVGSRANSYQFKAYNGNETKMTSIGWAGGNTANLETHVKDIIAINPKYCVCYLGTNDVLQGISLATFESTYSSLLEKLNNAKIQPLLCILPPINGTVPTTYNSTILKLGKKYLCYIVDLSQVGLVSSDFVDGIHPNSDGATKIANAIKTVLNEI